MVGLGTDIKECQPSYSMRTVVLIELWLAFEFGVVFYIDRLIGQLIVSFHRCHCCWAYFYDLSLVPNLQYR